MLRHSLICMICLCLVGCLETAVDPRPGPSSDLDAELFDVRVPINAPASGSGSSYGSGSGSGYETGSGANAQSSQTPNVEEEDMATFDTDVGVLDATSIEMDSNLD